MRATPASARGGGRACADMGRLSHAYGRLPHTFKAAHEHKKAKSAGRAVPNACCPTSRLGRGHPRSRPSPWSSWSPAARRWPLTTSREAGKTELWMLEAAGDGAIMAGPVGPTPPMLDGGEWTHLLAEAPHSRAQGMVRSAPNRRRGKRRSQLVTKRIITCSLRGHKPCVSGR
jgi:hypothetical protein